MSARILVVDDILPNVKLLEAKLVSEYYDVITATNGVDALRRVKEDSPDIVLLDIMMPGMDGFEVCRRLKEDPETSHIPVVMVTALTDAQDRVKGLENGADDFLSKPINDTALMARVRSLVRLKMTIDEWRVRSNTASAMGVMDDSGAVMSEPVQGAQVLLVEDQDFEVDKIKTALATDNNIILQARSGMEALELARGREFDLIAVSLNLGGEDGLRLCSHLRSNENTRSIPIMMIASPDDMPRVAHGLEIGAHDYIMRPIDKNEMLARARTQIRRKRFQERLRSNYEISLNMALTDQLTGLYNRRYFEVHMEKLIEDNKSSSKNLCVLYMDIDKFKTVNDTWGHNVGDEILISFAERLKDNMRSFDMLARLGGEEFVAVLPDVSQEKALYVAERMRRLIADEVFPCSVPEGALRITASMGGIIIADGDHPIPKLLERADGELYKAKQGGRNRVFFENIGELNPDDYEIVERDAAQEELPEANKDTTLS
jgi:two-component system cell cycle response regulator